MRGDVGSDDTSHIESMAGRGMARRDSLERSYLQQQHHHPTGNHYNQHHHQQQQHQQNSHHQPFQGPVQSPRFGDIDAAFLDMTDLMMPASEANFWAPYLGNETDQASTLNLFPLLEAGGGIDLANYL